ncbi:MAG: hypothetical protein PW788_15450 [Micavibrio sp.]|nr:hypothetical protein [Micavibrio sp.]
MQKPLQNDFNKIVKRAELFCEQAMVVTLGFAAERHDAFLDFLKTRDIPHHVIVRQDNRLTFAVGREKDLIAERIRGHVADFFADDRSKLMSEAYYQKFHSPEEMKQAMPKRLTPEQREVRRLVKNF